MQCQVTCLRCESPFWSKTVGNKRDKRENLVPLRHFCRKCENFLRHQAQIEHNIEMAKKRGEEYNPRVRSLEGVSEQNYLMMVYNQIEKERRAKEKKDKRHEQQRQRTEAQ